PSEVCAMIGPRYRPAHNRWAVQRIETSGESVKFPDHNDIHRSSPTVSQHFVQCWPFPSCSRVTPVAIDLLYFPGSPLDVIPQSSLLRFRVLLARAHSCVECGLLRLHSRPTFRSAPCSHLGLANPVDHLVRLSSDPHVSGLELYRSLGIDFVSVTEAVDTSLPAGELVFQMIGAVAQFERSLIAERVKSGLANARANGKVLGRPPLRKLTRQEAAELKRLRQQQVPFRDLAKRFGVSVQSVLALSL